MSKRKIKVLFSGGGTLGPVTPLLAVHEYLKEEYPEAEFIWVGTKNGPEKSLITDAGIAFLTIASGKLRRYLSFWNVTDIFKIIFGFFQSLFIIYRQTPDFCVSAGGFVSVPVHWAAWLFGIPTWVHQQDVVVGLANQIMAPLARVITTALKPSVKLFSAKKTFWLGNPVRSLVLQGERTAGLKAFRLPEKEPVVLALGGGTGSMRVNLLMIQAVQHLVGFCQVVHLSGRERPQDLVERAVKHFPYYQVHQFLGKEMPLAYAVADLVIARGGFGTLSELAALGKPAILIPKPGHQEENVKFLAQAGVVEVLDERTADGNLLARTIRELLADKERMFQMGEGLKKVLPPAKKEEILEIVSFLLK